MYKKILSFVLVGLLFSLVCHTTVKANSEKEAEFVERVRTAVTKLGTGREARVNVKLRDTTKIKGYISKVGEDGFVVINDKTKTVTQIPYSKVKQVQGKNNLTGEQILGVAVVALILIILAYTVN
jgi:hypothetical protein